MHYTSCWPGCTGTRSTRLHEHAQVSLWPCWWGRLCCASCCRICTGTAACVSWACHPPCELPTRCMCDPVGSMHLHGILSISPCTWCCEPNRAKLGRSSTGAGPLQSVHSLLHGGFLRPRYTPQLLVRHAWQAQKGRPGGRVPAGPCPPQS